MKAVCDRQAIVWDAIERLAFRPADRDGWLWCYIKSLKNLWGVEPTSVVAERNTEFEFLDLNIRYSYSIEATDRYSVTIGNTSSTAPAWLLHVDPRYCARSFFYRPDPNERYPTQDMDRHLEQEVATVLDGMIFHPRNHAHADKLGIAATIGGESELSSKEIRLGGGIENGFVFLTHLHYQFCLVSKETRQNERTCLIRLFMNAIRERRHEKGPPIPAGKLFGLRA
jgi:hypothetical protein